MIEKIQKFVEDLLGNEYNIYLLKDFKILEKFLIHFPLIENGTLYKKYSLRNQEEYIGYAGNEGAWTNNNQYFNRITL